MNNLKLYENNILVKADTKTQEFLTDWVQANRDKWLDKRRKQNTEDTLDIEQMETEARQKGMLVPYEKQLIPHFEEIKLEFKEALEDHQAAKLPSTMLSEFKQIQDDKSGTNEGVPTESIRKDDSDRAKHPEAFAKPTHADQHLHTTLTPLNEPTERKVGVSIIDSENVFIDDTLANKYKDNEREMKREQRYHQI